MKTLLISLLLSVNAFALDLQGDFKGPVGLQLYSLRDTFKTDPVQALDKTKAFGFTTAELYSTLPLETEKLKSMLAERGIVAVSGHFGYEVLKKDLAGSVKNGPGPRPEVRREWPGSLTKSASLAKRT